MDPEGRWVEYDPAGGNIVGEVAGPAGVAPLDVEAEAIAPPETETEGITPPGGEEPAATQPHRRRHGCAQPAPVPTLR